MLQDQLSGLIIEKCFLKFLPPLLPDQHMEFSPGEVFRLCWGLVYLQQCHGCPSHVKSTGVFATMQFLDAKNKQFTDRAVKEWLCELKDAVYHAEDLVDEIAQLRLCGARWKPSTKAAQTRLPTTSLVDETCVYGRENDKEEIMKLLLSDGEDSNQLDVILIVGMGGVGKTTVAQLLYNDGRVDVHFGEKAWVCVSDVFDVLSVTRTIVKAVNGSASDARDLNSLQVKLKGLLSGKKFLIVLDDVWNEKDDHWDALMTPFRSEDGKPHGILEKVRHLSYARGLQNVTISSDALEAKMTEKKHLEKLAWEWGSPVEDSQNEREEINPGLLQYGIVTFGELRVLLFLTTTRSNALFERAYHYKDAGNKECGL
ncbi:hypothetical protein RHMOL_Rhmol10G0082000 [Rhododendron molle]|uniref:Uncharacterized protein n=1 Tax=Rhododendron molle TaxID=49168 RepID=A0ACC0LZV7_RHOML|nr:hypothetical protein RHMOL_Rhmol10G0082000 [Rhododendron molle]